MGCSIKCSGPNLDRQIVILRVVILKEKTMGHLSKFLISGTALASCILSTPALAQSSCERFSLQRCSEVGQELNLDMRTAGGNAQAGSNDPLWRVQGAPAQVVNANSAWHTNSGRYKWISPTKIRTYSTAVYEGNFNIPEDPYYYDNLKLKISFGADNSARQVRVNGVVVFTGTNDNLDFKQGNFEIITVPAGNDGGPFRQGCNKIEIDVYNQGGPSGLSVRGALTGKCTKCTTAKLGRRSKVPERRQKIR